ncbi:Rrt7p [Saccharomyces cerevisiae S288C]|uniref:Regulator of rDNA transcription protein 7 n=2 Tax=Saccharomyces cerevisiae TaxID=4932 RepID=RRT7_YEAST|eukprot:NP_001335793.1 Rrt7p [Saccharomyces cerevisiae S288C]
MYFAFKGLCGRRFLPIASFLTILNRILFQYWLFYNSLKEEKTFQKIFFSMNLKCRKKKEPNHIIYSQPPFLLGFMVQLQSCVKLLPLYLLFLLQGNGAHYASAMTSKVLSFFL